MDVDRILAQAQQKATPPPPPRPHRAPSSPPQQQGWRPSPGYPGTLLRDPNYNPTPTPYVDPNLDLDYVDRMDTKVRDVVDILRSKNSVLILNPEHLEEQEQQAGAELYTAMVEVVEARAKEDKLLYDRDTLEASIFAELVLDHENNSPVAEGKKPASRETGKTTEFKKRAESDQRVIQKHNEWLDAQKHRRIAECYMKALEQKLTLIPGAQGSRNNTQ